MPDRTTGARSGNSTTKDAAVTSNPGQRDFAPRLFSDDNGLDVFGILTGNYFLIFGREFYGDLNVTNTVVSNFQKTVSLDFVTVDVPFGFAGLPKFTAPPIYVSRWPVGIEPTNKGFADLN
jgi:hypothetical protein